MKSIKYLAAMLALSTKSTMAEQLFSSEKPMFEQVSDQQSLSYHNGPKKMHPKV